MHLDIDLIQAIAAELGVNASFVEKDWQAVRILAVLASLKTENIHLIFSGGTSLSKGFDLIQRFSEDLDFKVLLSSNDRDRNTYREYRERIIAAILASNPEWHIGKDTIKSGNASRFFSCQIAYQQQIVQTASLRAHVKLEVTFQAPLLPFEERPLISFVAQAQRQRPEVIDMPCVSPVETGADKLSALTWRVLSRQRGTKEDDPTLVRHLHDLAALEKRIRASSDFPALVLSLLEQDVNRNKTSGLEKLRPSERLERLVEKLKTDSLYPKEYEQFVLGMSYAADNERTTYDQALTAVERIIVTLQDAWNK